MKEATCIKLLVFGLKVTVTAHGGKATIIRMLNEFGLRIRTNNGGDNKNEWWCQHKG